VADQERVKKAIARLYGMKDGLTPTKTGYIDGTQALDFNKAIDDLLAEGVDVDEFRIRENEIVDMAFGPPSVLYDTFITRLNAVLAYLTVKKPKIGFEAPRKGS
jgi:hypothetical protein